MKRRIAGDEGEKTLASTGFSLVELLVVMALISIVAAFAVPTWQRYSANSDLRTAAREVMADLANAKEQAVEENLDVYRITFNVIGNSYALSRIDTGVISWTKPMTAFGSGILIEGVNFNGESVASFQRRGTASLGNLTLRNRLGSRATITVTNTGRSYVRYNMQ